MRVARVLTNETCNLACPFCDARRPRERPEFVAAAAVRARVDLALASGAEAVVLSGGEPTLRRDLPALIRHARRGAEVVLETNAALITAGSARDLAAAGLARARVLVPAPEADAITRDPGASVAALAGMRALAAAGVALEVAVPIVRANLDAVAEIPGWLRAAALPVAAIVAVVPHAAPDAEALAPLADAARALEALDDAAQRAAIPLRLDPGAALPPCVFPRPQRRAHLYALSPGGAARAGHVRVAACGGCVAADRCPGVPAPLAARASDFPFAAIEEERTRRRLTLIDSPQAQIERELVTRDRHRFPDGRVVPSHVVRVVFQCNQACAFCFVSTHLPAPDEAAVRAAIAEVGRLGGVLQLSGGEPTLHPRLAELVAFGRRAGAQLVELQTNAVRLAEAGLAARLAEAGLGVAFVSLHGARAEVSDAITGAPGTFERTLAGVDALRAAGVAVRLNFVFCAANLGEFPALVRLAAARWPGVELNVSVAAAFTDLVPRSAALIPRMSALQGPLAEGLALADAAGLAVHGFESMCGIPLCLAPGDPRRHLGLAEIPPGFGRGEFVRAPACGRCDLASRCFGVRRSYAELHGTDELRPVAL